MSLTVGTGPFGPHARGRFDFEPPRRVVYVEPWPRRVRAFRNGMEVVDSTRAVLVYVSGRLPHYAFPPDDVRIDAAPERELDGYVRVPWDGADRWLEEDEEQFVHPRDPFHRIDVLRSSRQVQVRVGSELVAESTRPRILFETGLSPRYYLPVEDVRMDALEPLDIRTGCAYKGWATYWDAVTNRDRIPAVAWSYPEPLRDGAAIAGLLCFFQERPEIEVEVDGVVEDTVPSVYSRTAWLDASWVVRPDRLAA